MINRDISEFKNKRILIDGSISVPYNNHRKNCCIENCIIRRNNQNIDHLWLRQDQNPWLFKIINDHKHGDQISFRGKVYEYKRRDGSLGYSIGDIDQYIINGKGHRRCD